MYTEDGFKLSGSTSLQDTMNEKYSSYKADNDNMPKGKKGKKVKHKREYDEPISYGPPKKVLIDTLFPHTAFSYDLKEYDLRMQISYWRAGNMPQLLHQLAQKYECKFDMSIYREAYFMLGYSAIFSFKGSKENVEKLCNHYDLAILKNQLGNEQVEHAQKKEYKTDSFTLCEDSNGISGTIKVSPFSSFKKIPEQIAKLLKLSCEVRTIKDKVFGEKTVTFKADGDPIKLEKFKEIINCYIFDDMQAKSKKSKLRM